MKSFKSLALNDKIVLKNVFFSFIVKGASLVVSLLTTPALMHYFGDDDAILGVWFTLLSVLLWFLNFDLGIGNGIRNRLVKAFCNDDRKEAKHIISSGLFSVACVSVVLTAAGILLLFLIDLNWLFNIPLDVISPKTMYISVTFVFAAVMCRFFLTTITSIFYALQKSSMNNFLALLVSVLQLVFVLIFSFDNQETALIALSMAYLIVSNIPLIVAGVIVFCTSLKDCKPNVKYVDKDHIKKVLKIGGIFFMCQIMYMGIVNTNELLITKFFDPCYTTEYTVYYKITSLLAMVVSLTMTPIWSVVTKTIEENNWEWLNKLYKKIKIIGFCIIAVEFLVIPLLQIIINIWLKDNAIKVDLLTAVAFAVFGSVFVYSTMLSTIVCGMARMKLQAICYTVGVVFKFAFVIILAHHGFSWSVVVWSNALILLPYCILQQIDLNIYIKKKTNMTIMKTEDTL